VGAVSSSTGTAARLALRRRASLRFSLWHSSVASFLPYLFPPSPRNRTDAFFFFLQEEEAKLPPADAAEHDSDDENDIDQNEGNDNHGQNEGNNNRHEVRVHFALWCGG